MMQLTRRLGPSLLLSALIACTYVGKPVRGDYRVCEEDHRYRRAAAEEPPASPEPWERDIRLPEDVLPHHYDLYLWPKLEENQGGQTFTGIVTIQIQATLPRAHFQVHKFKDLIVTSTILKDSDGSIVSTSDPVFYEPHEFWVIPLANQVPAGNYSLEMEFNGRLDADIVGFYRSVYTDSRNLTHVIATSKFEPTHARKAFPCFDEPTFKSTFTITLVKPDAPSYIALSNMEFDTVTPDQPEPGLVTVKFHPSVPMVTYLAIFIVCEFEYLETTTEHGIPFKVYGTPDQQEHLQYALELGSHITDYYTTYFGVPYPLPKLDMAAIPDYSSGATEHWGLITFRATNLVYDPIESGTPGQQRVASVVSHELVHQWFGNLMTVKWWDDLWLNEGFAAFFEYKGVKSYESDWDTDSWFLTENLHSILDLDATIGSRPIVKDVETPEEITSIFDGISYDKGSSVIRMMESFMGESDFRLGLHAFLEKFQFDSAVTNDLFNELSEASSEGLNMNKIMDTWTRQKGYPVVTLTKSDNDNYYTARQERFLTNPEAEETENSPYNYKWEVPLTYTTSGNPEQTQVWLHSSGESANITIPDNTDWMKFNVEQRGYYRVNYPREDWTAFGQLLMNNPNMMSTPDKVGLLNDVFSLAAGNRVPYELALDMTKYLSHERALAPWEVTLKKLGYMEDVFYYYTELYGNLASYETSLVTPLYNELGWTDEGSVPIRLLRIQILDRACSIDMPDCLEQASKLFETWQREEVVKIPANLRSTVYTYGMQEDGNLEIWEWMFQRYLTEPNPQEQLKLLNSLASIQNETILQSLLDLSWNQTLVRRQDYFTLLTDVWRNRIGELLVWDFYRDNYPRLLKTFPENRSLGKLIATITSRFATEDRLQELLAFIEANPDPGTGQASRDSAVETVQNNIKFVAEYSREIETWLVKYNEGTPDDSGVERICGSLPVLTALVVVKKYVIGY